VEWRVLTGSGRTGRIVERDVRAAAVRSGQTAPAILTTEADATELVTLRPRLKAEDAPAPAYHHLIAKLAVVALADYPQLNAAGTEAVHLSLAVDTGDGLASPVIRDAHTKNWAELAAEARSLALQARRRALEPEAVQGGTFAIANLGMYGIDAFTPILRPPHRAALGLGRIAERPAVREGRVVPRALISLSLTVESGLLENGAAARFLDRLRSLIERPELGLQD
jgi:pyruvate dehydrogenase E2 component (dihydrolipoamide acetyltransferase)